MTSTLSSADIETAPNCVADPARNRPHAYIDVLLLAVLWICVHADRGIIHDARLYAVQALRRADPASFDSDLFFAFGSQDSFTIFTWLYAPLIRVFGLSQAHLLSSIIGQALWFAALLFLVRTLFQSGRERLFAAAAVIVLEPSYSALRVFQYGEAFTTPRLFAEACVLAALALRQRRRWLSMSLLLLLACALHPLMALPGIGVAALGLGNRRAWILIACGLALGGVAALAGIEPFARALLVLDDRWFEIARQRSAHGFLSAWPLLDILSVASKLAVLGIAMRVASASERRLVRDVLLAGVLGLVATLLGADLLRNVLVVNLQPWRALWLAAVFANLWAAIVVLRLPAGSLSRIALTLGLCISAAAHLLNTADLSSPLVLCAAGLWLWERHRQEKTPVWVTRAVNVIIVLLASLAIAFLAFVVSAQSAFPGQFKTLLAAATVMAAVILLVWPPFPLKRRAAPAIILAILAVICVDRRDGWRRFVDDPGIEPELAELTAGARHLYWEGAVDATWLKLRRASYFSCLQGAGAMFFRQTAIEFERRREALAHVTNLYFDCGLKEMVSASSGARESLEAACRGLPELDVLILTRDLDGLATRRWTPPATQYFVKDHQVEEVTALYRYDCDRFR